MLDQLSELHQLFASGRYSDVLSLCQEHSITPLSSPNAAKILAASYCCIGDYQKAYDLLTELSLLLVTLKTSYLCLQLPRDVSELDQ